MRDSFRSIGKPAQATCPEGCMSSSWTPAIDHRKNEVIKIKFSTKDCQCCPSLALCTQSTYQRRTITVRPEQHYQALQHARERAKTDDFKTLYARRAGVEGTISEASSRHGSASLSLYRPRKDASPASCHGRCYECRSHGSLARWRTSREDETLTFGSIASSSRVKGDQRFASSIKSVPDPRNSKIYRICHNRTRSFSFASYRFGSGSFKARSRNLPCIFCLKNDVSLQSKPRAGNRVEPSPKFILAEYSDKRPSAQYLRPNLQPIYQQRAEIKMCLSMPPTP
jgi:Transposase DDE domain